MLSFNKTIEVLIAAIDDYKDENYISANFGLLVVAEKGDKRAIAEAVKALPALKELFLTVGRVVC